MFEHGRQWGIYVKHTPNMRQLRLSSKIIVPFYSSRSFNNTEYIYLFMQEYRKSQKLCKNLSRCAALLRRTIDGVTG